MPALIVRGNGAAALPGSILGQLRSGAWLHGGRMRAYSRVLLTVEILTLAFLSFASRGYFGISVTPNTTDFVSFYAAGHLALEGTPALAYDQTIHFLAEQRAVGFSGFRYLLFFYPPIFLVLCSAFAALPYLAAFAVWTGATLAAYVAALRGTLRGATSILPFVAFPPVFLSIGLGQNALLTAGLLGGGIVLLEKRPFLSGLLFGALCYKPHFGLLLPIAFIAGGHWRVFLGATVAVVGTSMLSLAVFGLDSWMAFFANAATAPGTFEAGRVSFAGLVSPFGAMRLIGAALPIAYAVQFIATSCAAIAVALVWRRPHTLAHRGMILASGTLIALPVILFYDLALAGIVLAWLAVDVRRTGFYPWEKTLLIGIYAAPLLTLGTADALHFPLGQTATLCLFLLVIRRVRLASFQPVEARTTPTVR
jgi:alpha-1,2-mannosyltransferase